jgi:NAD+ synthase (glutamine-hydrolysing)
LGAEKGEFLRIAIAQLDYTIGAFETNLEAMRVAVERARRQSVDLVVFTELATTGYPPGDLLERRDFVDQNLAQLERVARLTDDHLGILVGFVDRNDSGTGKDLHNAVALCHRGEVTDRYRKCLLPTYDVFDEMRYFEGGVDVRPMEFRGVRIGVSVCEDVWADPDLDGRSLYHRDPVLELIHGGAQLLVNLSASPFELGKAGERRDLVRRYAEDSGRFFVYANQVGGNDDLVFDGHSMVFDGRGRVVARARDFGEDLLVYDVPSEALGKERGAAGPAGVIRDVTDSREAEALAALELGLRDYVRKCGFGEVLLGLSGGIDSALTAAIAARALGKDKVLGVAMPTRYSSSGSVADAEELANNLGIDFRIIPIDDIFQAYLGGLAPVFADLEDDVTEENIQARIRAAVLMALSNKFGRMLLATGNKSELAVGYCTLYGDMAGGLAVIADVPKTLVYGLARHINSDQVLIPESTIAKAPSAELRPDQADQDSLPPYEVLDRIVEAWVEEHRSLEEIVAEGFDGGIVREVVGMITRNEYKRRQAAPGIKITAKAFGAGRRYPIAAKY